MSARVAVNATQASVVWILERGEGALIINQDNDADVYVADSPALLNQTLASATPVGAIKLAKGGGEFQFTAAGQRRKIYARSDGAAAVSDTFLYIQPS